MSRFYDRNGKPLTLAEWEQMPKGAVATIARDEIGDVTVSTVFLGLDHGRGHPDPPLIFETMIFGGEHDEDQERYTTEQEALEGHRRLVEAERVCGVKRVEDG